MKPFILIPFTQSDALSQLAITGTVKRDRSQLELTFELTDNLKQVMMTTDFSKPCRRDNLWQATCFEFFLGVPGQSAYWEFNLAPSEHWNCYHFTDYRQGMTPASTVRKLPFTVKARGNQLTLHLIFNLRLLNLMRKPLELAIATVLETEDESLSYWALTHPGKEPDFHRRDSFILRLD